MQIKFNVDRTRILFIHENAYEYKNMMEFPAFLKEGPYFYVVAKIHVVFNILSRLENARNKFKNISVSKEVYEFAMGEMKLNTLPEDFKFITPPLDFQEIALRFMYTVGSGGLLLDPGMGKSKVTLDYIALQKFKRSLVICPKPLLFVWEDEVAKHRPDLTIHVAETMDFTKEWSQAKDKNILCTNYNKAVAWYDDLKKQNFDFIHLDEFLIKDHKTDRTKTITKLSEYIPYRCGGSGTLVNNSILDIFAPVRYLEPSLTGNSFTNFTNRHTIKNPRDLKVIVNYTKTEEAKSILHSCSIIMTKERWLKLPKKNFHDVYVNMGDDQREFYWSLKRNMIAKFNGEFIEVDNALVMMSKLYQVSNGFIYITPKGEEGEELLDLTASESKKKKKKSQRRTVYFENQPKIEALLNICKSKASGKRAIIWFNMEAELTLIKNALEENGFKFLTIKGGDNIISKKVRTFNTDPSYDYLVCQAKSVNYGITVLGTSMDKLEDSDYDIFPGIEPEVHTEIFYSCNFSLEVYLQQQDRIHRIGQTKECDYYRIFANTPVEHRIRSSLDDKMHIRQDVLIDIAEKILEDDTFLV